MDEDENGLSEDAAEAALLETLMGAKPAGEGAEASEGNEDEPGEYDEFEPNAEDLDEDGDEGDEADGDEGDEGDEGGEGDEVPATTDLPDTQEIVLQINGEARTVTLGDLKDLYGRGEDIVRKDQEVDLVGARAAAALQTAIQVISEDLQSYANVDWMVLRDQMDPETFAWHRGNAQALEAKYEKLVGAAQGVEQSYTERRQSVDREAVQAAVRELSTDIPGWSDQTYTDILKYGAEQGLDAKDLAAVTNPKVIKIIRKAMLHDRADKVATQKIKAAPAKVIKGAKDAVPAAKQVNAKKAMQRLAATGSDDAAVAALMGRWG